MQLCGAFQASRYQRASPRRLCVHQHVAYRREPVGDDLRGGPERRDGHVLERLGVGELITKNCNTRWQIGGVV